jgi:hypothetical protein
MALMIFGHICYEQLAVKQNMDVLWHGFIRHIVMTNRLLKEQSHEICSPVFVVGKTQ